ncbi:MAG: hypothetical protein OEV65_06190 [Aquincola sp.]|nr:hypothetical protein [Aquincola sp.]
MKAVWHWTLTGWALFALLVAIVLGLVFFVGLPGMIAAIEIDGHRIDLLQLRADHWALMALGVAIASLVIAVVVPLFAVLAVTVPLAGMALATLAAVAALGLVLAPVGLLVWWLWRTPRSKTGTTAP